MISDKNRGLHLKRRRWASTMVQSLSYLSLVFSQWN